MVGFVNQLPASRYWIVPNSIIVRCFLITMIWFCHQLGICTGHQILLQKLPLCSYYMQSEGAITRLVLIPIRLFVLTLLFLCLLSTVVVGGADALLFNWLPGSVWLNTLPVASYLVIQYSQRARLFWIAIVSVAGVYSLLLLFIFWLHSSPFFFVLIAYLLLFCLCFLRIEAPPRPL